jgi:hypothetical protein
MTTSEPPWLRIVVVGSALVWLVTLALPAYVYSAEFINGEATPGWTYETSGFECLTAGWLTIVHPLLQPYPAQLLPPEYGMPPLPFMGVGRWSLASIAWYANPLWAWNLARMWSGKRPRILLAMGASLLGLMALQFFWVDTDDISSAHTPLIGAYVWAACMSVPTFAWVFATAIEQTAKRAVAGKLQ